MYAKVAREPRAGVNRKYLKRGRERNSAGELPVSSSARPTPQEIAVPLRNFAFTPAVPFPLSCAMCISCVVCATLAWITTVQTSVADDQKDRQREREREGERERDREKIDLFSPHRGWLCCCAGQKTPGFFNFALIVISCRATFRPKTC